jgi:hypothetical protein
MLMTVERLFQIALACGFYGQSDLARVFRPISDESEHFGVDVTGQARRVTCCTLYLGERSGQRAPGE